MKTFLLFLILFSFIVSCEVGGNKSGEGRIKIEAFDSPPPADVEHIYLTIAEVSVHKSGGDWITLAEPDTTFDFLELINGVTEVFVDEQLSSGDYTQLRMEVSDSNTIVISGVTHDLKVPSGEQTGVKLNLNFTVEADQIIEIYVDFDVSKSITWTPGNYLLRPSFKAFKKVVSGTVAGTVTDTNGVAIQNALIDATGTDESFATVTDSLGSYKLILLNGTYTIQASAEGYSEADTTYTNVYVQAEADLTGYDFILQ